MSEEADAWLRRAAARIRAWIPKQRKYASGFDWDDKNEKEVGIARIFRQSLEKTEGIRLSEPSLAPEDPPDCLAVDASGDLVGIEVTEFVSEKTVEDAQQGKPVPRPYPWTPESTVQKLRDIVREKDGKPFRGGGDRGFAHRFLVIHTAEGMLYPGLFRETLRDARYGPAAHLTGAFLLFQSYPGEDPVYPLIRLDLT